MSAAIVDLIFGRTKPNSFVVSMTGVSANHAQGLEVWRAWSSSRVAVRQAAIIHELSYTWLSGRRRCRSYRATGLTRCTSKKHPDYRLCRLPRLAPLRAPDRQRSRCSEFRLIGLGKLPGSMDMLNRIDCRAMADWFAIALAASRGESIPPTGTRTTCNLHRLRG